MTQLSAAGQAYAFMVLNLAKGTTKNPLMDTVGLVGRCPAVTLSTGRFNLRCRVLYTQNNNNNNKNEIPSVV